MEATRRAIRQLLVLRAEIQDLRGRIQEEESSSLHSPRLDGMPHGSAAGDAAAARMIRLEAMRRCLQDTEAMYIDAKRKAEWALLDESVGMRAFCEIYYVDDLGYEMARTFSGETDEVCRRYIRQMET